MPNLDSYVLMGMGGFLLLLGIIFFLWTRSEERKMDYGLSQHDDLREFLNHWPMRIEPGALRVGGWIFVIIGLTLIIIGGIFLIID